MKKCGSKSNIFNRKLIITGYMKKSHDLMASKDVSTNYFSFLFFKEGKFAVSLYTHL